MTNSITSGDSNLRRSQTPERINSTVYAETPHDRIHPRIHRNSENCKTTKTPRIIRRKELIHKRTKKRHFEHHNRRRACTITLTYIPPPSYSQDILRGPLLICSTETPFRAPDKSIYQQIDGVSMGTQLGNTQLLQVLHRKQLLPKLASNKTAHLLPLHT